MRAILASAFAVVTSTATADVLQLAPVTVVEKEKTLAFFELPGCDVEVECVPLVLSCGDFALEMTATYFSHQQLAEWLLANRARDTHGDVALLAGDSSFPLHAVAMEHNDMHGLWEVTAVVTGDASEVWTALQSSQQWSIRLHPHQMDFSLNGDGRRALRKLREKCKSG